MADLKKIRDLIECYAEEENAFLGSDFLAPVLAQSTIAARIAGVICRMRALPGDFEGWGIFRAVSQTAAEFMRPATLSERKSYLQLFPVARLILCRQKEKHWLALPAHSGDQRFDVGALAPVYLVEAAQRFDVVQARFDGLQFWFEEVDSRQSLAASSYLRNCFSENVSPDDVQRSALSRQQRETYGAAYQHRIAEQLEAHRDWTEKRLRDALAHAGGRLVDYREHRDGYQITYLVDGNRHVSSVSKERLTVQTAGVCLSGTDKQFDLQSLVGVLREGKNAGEI